MIEISSDYIANTMAVVLWIEGRKLPDRILEIFESANNPNTSVSIWISAMTLAEIGYLFERERIDTALEDVNLLVMSSNGFKIADLTNEIVRKSFEIKDIPELHDRLIAGTAYTFNCPLLTNDPKIEKSSFVKTIWK